MEKQLPPVFKNLIEYLGKNNPPLSVEDLMAMVKSGKHPTVEITDSEFFQPSKENDLFLVDKGQRAKIISLEAGNEGSLGDYCDILIVFEQTDEMLKANLELEIPCYYDVDSHEFKLTHQEFFGRLPYRKEEHWLYINKNSPVLGFKIVDTLKSEKASKYAKIGKWLLTGHTGLSSKFMAAIALGASVDDMDGKHPNYPHDGGDFGRCLKLLQAAPEVKESFPEIAKSSKEWKGIIENWDELEAAYMGNLEQTVKDGVVYTLYDLILKVTRPEEFARQEKLREDREKAKLKAIEPKLKYSPLGVLLRPDIHLDKDLIDSIIASAVKELSKDLLTYGHIGKDDITGLIDDFQNFPWLSRENGITILKALGFDDCASNAMDLADLLDTYPFHFRDAYNAMLLEWITKNDVKPTLSVGQKVSFKHGMTELAGKVIAINNTRSQPMNYIIKVDGRAGKPMIYWDDASLKILG